MCLAQGHNTATRVFVFEQQLLFRVDSLCDLGFSALGWGKHHALITRVDKPSLAQVRPYPTLVLPYHTLPSPTLPPTLRYPTLPYTLPQPYALPYPTLPYPTPNPTLPYPTLCPALPYPTLPYPHPMPCPTLPYPALPCPAPTPPHPTLPYLLKEI